VKVVINRCFGGFSLSEAAYVKLIEWGIPVRGYIEQKQNPETGLYLPEPLNEGEVIFDRELADKESNDYKGYAEARSHGSRIFGRRYWEVWSRSERDHPLIVRVVEELGADANGDCADLEIVEVPEDVNWYIEEYDGMEHVAEQHRTWR
jgi:hypothetical protein